MSLNLEDIKDDLVDLAKELPELSETSLELVKELRRVHAAEVEGLAKVAVMALQEAREVLKSDDNGICLTEDIAITLITEIFRYGHGCGYQDSGEDSHFS